MVDLTPNYPGSIVRRRRIMALGFGLLILVFGVIIGAGGTFLHFKDRFIQNRGFGGPDPKRILQDMQSKLSLTDEQVKQIEDLFRQQGQAWMEFNKKTAEFQKQQWEATMAGMKSILTVEQSAAWQKDMDERRQRWEKEQRERGSRGQGGPGRGGPEGQRGQGGPDGRRDRSNPGDRQQQGPPPGGPMPGGPGPGPDQPEKPTTPPPGAPMPDQAPKPAEPETPPAATTTPPTTPEEPKPL